MVAGSLSAPEFIRGNRKRPAVRVEVKSIQKLLTRCSIFCKKAVCGCRSPLGDSGLQPGSRTERGGLRYRQRNTETVVVKPADQNGRFAI